MSIPETRHTFSSHSRHGFGGWRETVESAQAHDPGDQFEAMGKVGADSGVQVITTMPAPLPGVGSFPVEFVIASTAEPIELVASPISSSSCAEERVFVSRTPI